jgi:hypothetical protein
VKFSGRRSHNNNINNQEKKIMKQYIIRAIAVLSLMAPFSAMTADAQTGAGVKFEAPFEFTVGGKTLPAGKYSIERLRYDASDILVIRDADRNGLVNFRVARRASKQESDTCKLIFHRYGNTSFLKQIQYGYGIDGYELFKSRAEREMIKQAGAKKDSIASAEVETFEVVTITGQ